jgi:hypothetical protein
MKTLLAIAVTLFICQGVQAHQVGNGGSITVDGHSYELADLHFKPNSFASYTFDKVIEKELSKLGAILRRLNLTLQHSSADQFFDDYIYNELIEYRFVGHLPSDCQYMTRENLPSDLKVLDIACTKGYVTYIIPSYFKKLNVTQQTLLLVHERLQFFAPEQPYDIKTEVIRAFDLLLTRYYSAAQSASEKEIFSDDEVFLLNRLSVRFRQLNNDKGEKHGAGTSLHFLKTGAALETSLYYQASQPAIVGTVILGAGTVILFTGDPKDAHILGQNFKILNSIIRISSTELDGINAIVRDSTLGLSFGSYPSCSARLLPNTILQNLNTLIFECGTGRPNTLFQFGKEGSAIKLDGEGSRYPYRLWNGGSSSSSSSLLSIDSQEKLRTFIDTTPDYGH